MADPWAVPDDVLEQRAKDAAAAEQRRTEYAEQPPAPAPTPRRRPTRRKRSTTKRRGAPGAFVAKYDGWCGSCETKVLRGDTVFRGRYSSVPICETCQTKRHGD